MGKETEVPIACATYVIETIAKEADCDESLEPITAILNAASLLVFHTFDFISDHEPHKTELELMKYLTYLKKTVRKEIIRKLQKEREKNNDAD